MLDSPAAIQFIDKLIEQKGFHGLDDEIKEQLREDLLKQLEIRVSSELIASLSSTDLVKFEHLIDTNELDKLPGFLKDRGVNMQAVVARAMIDFQTTYLED